jgi:DNA-directed RNA polymerase specialized sigma subunit
MKCLATCKKIIANEQVDVNELSEFIAEYCISQKREDGLPYIPVFIQLIQMGQFDLIEAIKRYCASNGKQFLSIIDKNGLIITQWIEE